MKLKISISAKNHINPDVITGILGDKMLEIAKDAMPLMRKRLNSTEEPDSDPRRSHINVKKWRVYIKSRLTPSSLRHNLVLRAENTQAPTYYIAYRRLKNKPGLDKVGPKKRPHLVNFDTVSQRPLSREEYNDAMNYIKKTYEYTRQIGYSKKQSNLVRSDMMKRYKKLVPVKVKVDNIAFSRMFSARNVIRPNPSKYSSYDYAQCLKVWDKGAGKFRYIQHAHPKTNNDNYYYSRLRVMTDTVDEVIGEYHDRN